MKYVAPIALTLALTMFGGETAGAFERGSLMLPVASVNAAGDGSDATSNANSDPNANYDAGANSDAGADPGDSGTDASADSYPRVTAIENALLGQAYPKDELEARIARLEQKAFGKTSPQVDLGDRTDALQQYAEKKLNKKLFKEDPNFVSTDEVPGSTQPGDSNAYAGSGGSDGAGGANGGSEGGTPNRARAVGTALGTTLLNIAGFGMPGFGGVRVRNRADLPPEEQAAMQAKEHQDVQEDPAVSAKEAPPDSAKLLTKVGWCEMQIWGHTFPTMHLTQRLTQLNGEVNFAPGKTGIALMDCSAAMIKASQQRGPSSGKNLSTSQPSAPQ